MAVDVVATKNAELKKMKASNPVVNYETFEKDGEVMLDFLVSENTPDGKYLSIVERNVYRYKSVVDKNGQKGVLLFGVSERAYGDDIDKFFPNLKCRFISSPVSTIGIWIWGRHGAAISASQPGHSTTRAYISSG